MSALGLQTRILLKSKWGARNAYVHSEFRDGNAPAGHEHLRALRDSLAALPYAPNRAGYSKGRADYRFLAIREPPGELDPGDAAQLPFPTEEFEARGRYKLFALAINLTRPADRAIRWHRERCGRSEEVRAALKRGLTGGHMPSGPFGANAAGGTRQSGAQPQCPHEAPGVGAGPGCPEDEGPAFPPDHPAGPRGAPCPPPRHPPAGRPPRARPAADSTAHNPGPGARPEPLTPARPNPTAHAMPRRCLRPRHARSPPQTQKDRKTRDPNAQRQKHAAEGRRNPAPCPIQPGTTHSQPNNPTTAQRRSGIWDAVPPCRIHPSVSGRSALRARAAKRGAGIFTFCFVKGLTGEKMCQNGPDSRGFRRPHLSLPKTRGRGARTRETETRVVPDPGGNGTKETPPHARCDRRTTRPPDRLRAAGT